MTEIQQTNIAVANFIIGEFDKAFESVFGRSDDAVNAVRGVNENT